MTQEDLRMRIVATLQTHGPLQGAQLVQHLGAQDPLVVWRDCKTNPDVVVLPLGKRFLRLDRSVDGYARLSPSIRREFLTYSVVGLTHQRDAMVEKLRGLELHIGKVSVAKQQLAASIIRECFQGLGAPDLVETKICAILAGDVVYQLAHDVPRPEDSTGQMVRGSDLDIIIVTADDVPEEAVRKLDDEVLKKKHFLLVHPEFREEIDYLIKPLRRVREQVQFDTFEHMVACKILNEGCYLGGSHAVFEQTKQLLTHAGVPEKLRALQRRATEERKEAEMHLLTVPLEEAHRRYLHLFYTREESEEIY